jgi:uncharacterized membrane protein YcaP (DUF421 family)
MNQLASSVERTLGAHVRAEDLTILQIALRAVLVFLVWLAIVRMADRRLLGKYSAFDVVLAVMLGSVLSRAINGSAPLWGTLGAAAVLVAMHWVLTFLSFHWHAFGHLVKGLPRTLIENGKVYEHELRKNLITNHDLCEMLRLQGRIADPSEAKLATLERNGQISAIPREPPRPGTAVKTTSALPA